MIVSLAFAMGYNYVIGKEGRLPWTPDEVPGEQALFKKTTRGKPVVMGRKTWESLPAGMRPLLGRKNFILTRDLRWNPELPPGNITPVEVYRDLDRLLGDLAGAGHAEVVVIGGADLFAQAYERAERAYVTLVDGRHAGDTFFPRAILSDPRWAWQPDSVRGRGWTRYRLDRVS